MRTRKLRLELSLSMARRKDTSTSWRALLEAGAVVVLGADNENCMVGQHSCRRVGATMKGAYDSKE